MLEDQIILYCAPTLAGIKTGNLFTCAYESKRQIASEINKLNRRIVPKGLCVLPLKFQRNRVLIYVFRPNILENDLSREEALKLLAKAGYQADTARQCIMELIHRLNESEGFPHEIGLFLGYPPEDVEGFIENKSQNYKCVGCWKVYGNEEEAKRQFMRFDKCTKCYYRYLRSGLGLDQLAVVV